MKAEYRIEPDMAGSTVLGYKVYQGNVLMAFRQFEAQAKDYIRELKGLPCVCGSCRAKK